jgi:phage N-6-adenine-methyltransferase
LTAKPCYTAPRDHTWETPPDFYDRLNAEFAFTLDVCASVENTKCGRFFTYHDDGLAQDWAGETCWMNPPYGREIGKWMGKAVAEAEKGATVVCLVPARTDTAWWHDYALRGEVRYIRGRLKFGGGIRTNPQSHNAPFPCAVVVLRPGLKRASGEQLSIAA